MARKEEIVKDRLKKINELRKKGVEPYLYSYNKEQSFDELQKKYKLISKDQKIKDRVKTAGRVLVIRDMGKINFATLQDDSGKIQIVLQEKETPSAVIDFFKKYIDTADFIGVEGTIMRTKKGELSILVKKIELLSKAILPLPEKWHGLQDIEERYRKRYLDLIMNPKVKEIFMKKAEFIKNIKKYLEKNGFLEVETPVLERVPGGADARPFITHHNILDIDLYLRISLELHLKRLLIGNFEKVYEIGRVFRNEGMSTEHLQEFTLLEFYIAYKDYEWLMDFCETFYKYFIKKTFGSLKIKYKNIMLNFDKKWPRLDYTKTLKKYTGIDLDKCPTKESLIREIENKKLELEIDKRLGRGRIIDQLYKSYVRAKLIQPCFFINHPVDISPLAKKHRKLKGKVERFQILVAGSEVGNAFSELNDPLDQEQRFKEQAKLREAGDEEAHMFDKDFVEALKYGMPPAAGFGLGIDRFFSILTNSESIRDVVFFPTMKPEEK